MIKVESRVLYRVSRRWNLIQCLELTSLELIAQDTISSSSHPSATDFREEN